jgi:LacI family transcriptional regulator
VIVQNLLHPFFADFLRVIYGVCQTRGYHVLVGHAEQGEHEGVMLGDLLSHDRVDGLLLIGDVLQHVGDEAQMQTVLQMHRHVVSVGCRASAVVELSIAVDNAAGVTMALEYLVALGHRSIAYIAGPIGSDERDSWESEQRRAAYRRFMTSRGLPRAPEQEVVVTEDLAAAQDALRRLITSPARPTAAFVVNDWTAIVTLKAALTCGIRVPGDLSLIGFDDIAVSALYTPALTTIHQPLDAMGHYAATALLDSIEGRPPARPHIEAAAEGVPHTVFAPTLVRRESCGPPSTYVG